MTSPVETSALTKRYGPITAVTDLDLTVRTGEVYGFLGPNGAGKTTTLRMLLGLIKPTSGTIRLFGAVPGPHYLDRVGALIEGPAFYPYLSGRDNLRVLAAHAGADSRRVATVLRIVDLADRAGDRYGTYSLGMKQRLGLAAALLKDPALLILDEPTNGLDPAGMADIRATIRRLADDGRTVLLSSHLLGEVQQICDRVGMISAGRLVSQLSVAELSSAGLRVIADPLPAARERVAAMIGADRITEDGDALYLDTTDDMVPRINAELVNAGLAVRELHRCEPDLERTFLELTGSGGDPHAH
ncbi:ABC transporter ATP-binding protein [Prauserella marina]|uniref:ABC-2 type transport system ATP-binding protein n=1 Tax=Prauserella marina TaxID=530584 RepID=A0A222VQL8_9PSEU|nr:ABC transporter ATP-binding protein [Prauserella marina]ASR36200.1 ABC transporter ATP-binding protein [Prauserella marina]PWV76954.1 ABC-2 type transport system ATP-binding protein [Prauserella marina]SDD01068.1 ABC-2 type transport system ATP-binding protein [Prauserella marina]